MNQEQVIELKVGPQNSNPAKNEVLEPSTDTVLKVYLREIANYPQLSFEEEKVLAQQISTDTKYSEVIMKTRRFRG